MTISTNDLVFLACGGTIDKVYADDVKNPYGVGEPSVTVIVRRARAAMAPPQSLLKKDSLDMDDEDRGAVAETIAAHAATRFVITHGTDTMSETARAIAAHPDIAEKTVVLVGSFAPAIFRDSDADFNIGFAAAAALCLPAGIYVAMNGKIIPAETVRKNRKAVRFDG